MDYHPDLRRDTARGALVMSLQSACFFGDLQQVGFSDRQWRMGVPQYRFRELIVWMLPEDSP